jgi:metal-responsive CopG/Arc/MetJ family transcriptional regulator
MKTVQMTLDEALVEEVDRVVHTLGTTRSSFTRDALREALTRVKEKQLEERHRAGYAQHPVRPGEFDGWEGEQVWGD